MTFFKKIVLCLLFAITGLTSGVLFFIATTPCIDLSALAIQSKGNPSIVLDDEGNELFKFQLERRATLSLASAPNHLIKAFVIAEDHQFFSHFGLSWRGILRAVATNLYHRKFVQGASTITQQLVKLAFFTNERSLWRKIKEQMTALLVEHQFSKEQILEAYLNHCYFGSGVYGVESAAERFWGIKAEQLTVPQCALLAGIIRNPQRYSPLYHPEAALHLRNVILKSMRQHNAINQQEYERYCKEPLNITQKPPSNGSTFAPHVRELVRQFLENLVGKEMLYSGGLVIQTTINKKLQEHAYNTFQKKLAHLKTIEAHLDGAVVCLDSATAAIKALIGGISSGSSLNRATQISRPMGSMFKPIVYTTALENGLTFADVRTDEPLTGYDDWSPQNVNETFEGPMTLARALMLSNNIIPIKLFLELGGEKVMDCATRFHLPPQHETYPALALGCAGCSPLQAAAMYNTFVTRGIYQEPHLVEWIKDNAGRKVWRHKHVTSVATNWAISSQIISALHLAAKHLKNRLQREDWLKGDYAGKTGTTNDNRSCWFAGITPKLTCVVYLGCDDNRSMATRIFSSWHAVPLWLEINQPFDTKNQRFFFDPQLECQTVHQFTGAPTTEQDPNALTILKRTPSL